MTVQFDMIPLANLLRPSNVYAEIDPEKNYRLVTVKLWGKGVEIRSEVEGTSIIDAKLFVAKENQFILSKIDARNGAFGLIPSRLNQSVVSTDFPLFDLNTEKVLPDYLNWMSKTKAFVHLCAVASEGTTNRVRLKIDRFLASRISLPSIEEQHRIVARIEELAAKIEEARGLRREAVEEADKLVEELEFQLWPDEDVKNNSCSLEEVTVFLSRGRHSEQGYSDHYLIKTQHVQLGKYIKSQFTLDSEIAERVQPEATVKKGDVLIACSAAGCLGRVAQFMEDQLASTDTHVAIARANTRVILPEYLYAYLKGAQGQIQLRSRERGDWTREKVGFRLTELNLADLKRVPVPVPSIPEQRNLLERLENLQSKLNIIKGDQSVTSAELNALLPAILDKAFKGEL